MKFHSFTSRGEISRQEEQKAVTIYFGPECFSFLIPSNKQGKQWFIVDHSTTT